MPASVSSSSLRRAVQSAPLASFFGLTYALAWLVWIPAGMLDAPLPVVLLGAVSPTIAGAVLAGTVEGREGVARLFRRVTQFRVGARPYVIAVAGPLAVAAAAVAVATAFGAPAPSWADVPRRLGLPPEAVGQAIGMLPFVFAGSFLGGPLLEEVGWRGYAQPRLQERIGAGWAGLVIGGAWSLWHLPLLASFPAATAGIPLPYYLPLVIAFGVCFAWMHVASRGSVLLTIVLHAGVNFAFGAYGPLDVTATPARLAGLVGVTALVAAAAFVHLQARDGAVR